MQPTLGEFIEVHPPIQVMVEAVGALKRPTQRQQQRAPRDRHRLAAGHDDAGVPRAFPAGLVKRLDIIGGPASECTEVAFDNAEVARVERLAICGQLGVDDKREKEVTVIEAIECTDDEDVIFSSQFAENKKRLTRFVPKYADYSTSPASCNCQMGEDARSCCTEVVSCWMATPTSFSVLNLPRLNLREAWASATESPMAINT